MEDELLDYQIEAINNLDKICKLKGKRILEIGGSPPFTTAKELLNRGAKHVTVINNRPDLKNIKIRENIEFINMDARKLDFESESFDIVFGVAVLEHLSNLNKVLYNIKKIIANRGYIYLQGGPIWSCALGHHIYIKTGTQKYQFNKNNPIPNWSHLVYSKEQLKKFLRENKNIHSEDSEKIAEWVYDSQKINRYFYEDYVKIIKESGLKIIKFNEKVWDINNKSNISEKNILFILKSKDNEKLRNYSTCEIEVVLTK